MGCERRLLYASDFNSNALLIGYHGPLRYVIVLSVLGDGRGKVGGHLEQLNSCSTSWRTVQRALLCTLQ